MAPARRRAGSADAVVPVDRHGDDGVDLGALRRVEGGDHLAAADVDADVGAAVGEAESPADRRVSSHDFNDHNSQRGGEQEKAGMVVQNRAVLEN